MIQSRSFQSKGFSKPKERARDYEADKAARTAANRKALCTPARTLHTATMTGSTVLPKAAGKGKPQAKVRHDIRQSAKGEECTVNLPGCPWDPEKTIWSHARWILAAKGGTTKSVDLAGAYCCTYCDGVYDGQTPRPEGWTQEMVDSAWSIGHFRSLVRLAEKGLL